jgi:hypothetical protein
VREELTNAKGSAAGARKESATPTVATVRCIVSGSWRACVYYRLQESPCVTEIELYSRNSTKQM